MDTGRGWCNGGGDDENGEEKIYAIGCRDRIDGLLGDGFNVFDDAH